ncbi:hypothetical protein Tco_1233177 [Tanacetum coccineum]
MDLEQILEQIDDMDIEEMDINWQIAMIAIRMKEFYKKTGRRVRIDGTNLLVLTKRSLNVSNVTTLVILLGNAHPRGQMMEKRETLFIKIKELERDSFYQDQGAGKKEQNQNCLLTMDDEVVN